MIPNKPNVTNKAKHAWRLVFIHCAILVWQLWESSRVFALCFDWIKLTAPSLHASKKHLPWLIRCDLPTGSPFTWHREAMGWRITVPSILSIMQCSASIPGPDNTVNQPENTIINIEVLPTNIKTLDISKVRINNVLISPEQDITATFWNVKESCLVLFLKRTRVYANLYQG